MISFDIRLVISQIRLSFYFILNKEKGKDESNFNGRVSSMKAVEMAHQQLIFVFLNLSFYH